MLNSKFEALNNLQYQIFIKFLFTIYVSFCPTQQVAPATIAVDPLDCPENGAAQLAGSIDQWVDQALTGPYLGRVSEVGPVHAGVVREFQGRRRKISLNRDMDIDDSIPLTTNTTLPMSCTYAGTWRRREENKIPGLTLEDPRLEQATLKLEDPQIVLQGNALIGSPVLTSN
ncbi:hypothetical protein BT96DRAFT_949314 [Gymnopus androsaceus JB14]|uniref:Uncharacterized protein n=1 Tax=Gymnopus androsaceus JB14 TaxID=1447944 RepID=A0A6A4GLN2_9AGAR|nr:hypothetical protein BT96DRAFT_949314 [Gymnopus androsaceus JB14]